MTIHSRRGRAPTNAPPAPPPAQAPPPPAVRGGAGVLDESETDSGEGVRRRPLGASPAPPDDDELAELAHRTIHSLSTTCGITPEAAARLLMAVLSRRLLQPLADNPDCMAASVTLRTPFGSVTIEAL